MRAKMSQHGLSHGRFFSTILGLSALLFVSSACQFGGSFEETRCDNESDCSGEATCVEGYCALPGTQTTDPIPDTGKIEDDAGDMTDDPDGLNHRVIVEIQLTPDSLDLTVGQSETIVPVIFDDAGDALDDYSADEFSWSSDAPGVAVPVGGGEIRGLSSGSAVITVSFGELSATAEVAVAEASAGQIELFPATITLMKTNIFEAQARAYDLNGTLIVDPVVDWSTANPGVATVDDDGNVLAVGRGSTELTVAMRADPTIRATSDVVVSALVSATALISPSQATITAGQKIQFEVYDNAFDLVPNADITWTSVIPTVATVSEGLVTGMTAGTVNIEANIGGVVLVAELAVEPRQVVRIDVGPPLHTFAIGKEETYVAEAFALDGWDLTDDTTFTWTVPDAAVATSLGDGKVKAVGVGIGIVEASVTTLGGEVKGYAGIEVKRHPVDSITITPSGVSELAVGASVQLGVLLTADGVSISSADRLVQWSSNRESVAVVDGTGKVTAIGDGTATITGTSEGESATKDITVNPETPEDKDPIAFGQTVTIVSDTSLTFNLAAYDPEGEELTYDVGSIATGKGSLSLDHANEGIVTYTPPTMPLINDAITFKFKVKDRAGNESNEAEVEIVIIPGQTNTPPTAKIVSDLGDSGDTCDTFRLSANDSSDNETAFSALEFKWKIMVKPDGSNATLSAEEESVTELMNLSKEGIYFIRVIVTDEQGASDTEFIEIEIEDGGSC